MSSSEFSSLSKLKIWFFNLLAFSFWIFIVIHFLFCKSCIALIKMTKKQNFRTSRKTRRRGKSSSMFISSGREEIATVTTQQNLTTITAFPLVPTFIPGSRLEQLALTFSQFKIISSVFQFVPVASSTTIGRFAGAFTFDTTENPPTNAEEIIQMSRAVYGNLWRSHSCVYPRGSQEKKRFPTIRRARLLSLNPSDQQEFIPATFVFATDSFPSNGLLVGHIYWHYKLQFFNPTVADVEDSGGATINFSSLYNDLADKYPDEDEED